MIDIVDELKWRGLIALSTDEEALRKAFADGPVTFYCGFDPTAPSLHMGNLVQLITMRRIQDAGNFPLGLVFAGEHCERGRPADGEHWRRRHHPEDDRRSGRRLSTWAFAEP